METALVGPKDEKDTEEELLERNVVPLRMNSPDDYVDILLSICQKAAKGKK